MSNKADLKAAMASLQVSTPLKLPAKAPTFRTPPAPVSQDVELPEDHNTSTASKLSMDVSTSQDNSSAKAPTTKSNEISHDDTKPQCRNESLDQIPSETIAASQASTTTTDALATQDELPPLSLQTDAVVPRTSQPRRATEQDRAVTETTNASAWIRNGYTRIPNSLLMEIVSGDLSRNETKLLLLIARMTISFNNRPLAPLSKGVIERYTGVQGRAVLEAVQSLEQARLIRKVPGNHNTPNRLGLMFDQGLFMKSSDEKLSLDDAGTLDQESSKRKDGFSPHNKDSFETIGLRKKISLSTLTEPLREYFSNLKPRRKRETEFAAYEELRLDFTEEQIAQCLGHLTKHGTPGSGSTCHSPMAYLSKAITQVLPEVIEAKERQRQSDAKNQMLAEEARKKHKEIA